LLVLSETVLVIEEMYWDVVDMRPKFCGSGFLETAIPTCTKRGLRPRAYLEIFQTEVRDPSGFHFSHRAGSVRQSEMPPAKREYIAKADGTQRPLGIAALEEKIVQQATRTILEQIDEVSCQWALKRG
jgi:hypothetical protein